jgi:hypothetical protein
LVPDLALSLFRGFPEKPDEKSEKELKVDFTYQVTFHPGDVMVKIVGTDRDTIFDLVKKIEALTAKPLDLPKIDPSMVEPEWIEWNGGECPVPKGTMVKVRYRCGREGGPFPAGVELLNGSADACDMFWRHEDEADADDIVAYSVLSK